MRVSPEEILSIFVPVGEVFPDVADDYETLKALLSGIDRNSALINCAQLNLILSDPTIGDDERGLTAEERRLLRQQKLVPLFFSKAEAERLNAFANRHPRVEPIVFFREQVLELIRWVVLICGDAPGHEVGGADREDLNRKFIKALLIAGSFWSRRVYRNDLESARGRSRSATVEKAIRALRNATTLRIDPITAVGRGHLLAREMCAIDPTFQEIFESRTNCSFDEYFLALFVLLGFTLGHHSLSGLSVIINLEEVRAQTPGVEPGLRRVLQLLAQTAAELRQVLWGTKSEPAPEDLTIYNLRPAMKSPVLSLPDDRAVVLDAAFLGNQAIVGPLFHVADGADREQSKRIFGVFGKAFEGYCLKTLRHMYPSPPAPLFDPLSLNEKVTAASGKELEIDAVLALSTSRTAAVFEVKSAFLPDSWVTGSPEDYVIGLRKRYGITEDEGVKGAGQLARFLTAAFAVSPRSTVLQGTERIIPVLLVYDPLLDAPLQGEFLAGEFAKALLPDETLANGDLKKGIIRIANLVIMTVDDLELLEASVKEFSLIELLTSYSDDVPNRNVSLYNYIAFHPWFSKRIWYSERLREQFSRELEGIEKMLAPDKPRA